MTARLKQLLLVLAVVLAACGGQTTTPPPAPAPSPLPSPTPIPTPTARPAIVPDTTKVADPATRTALSSYDAASGVLRFSSSTPALAALKPGDVLVSEPSAAAPDGYLRKVSAVRQDGTDTVLDTSQANLTDAVSQGDLIVRKDLTASDMKSATTALKGVSLITHPGVRSQVFGPPTNQLRSQVGIGDSYNFTLSFHHVFMPSGAGATGQVTVDGSVDFNVGYGVDVGISACFHLPPVCVDSFQASAGFAQHANLHISGNVQGPLGDEVNVATQYFDPEVFFIGPVPVVLIPRLDLYLSAGGQVTATFDFQASESITAQVGARWTDDDGWKDISGLDIRGDTPTPTFQGNLKANAAARSSFSFTLYGVAGPEMSLSAGLQLDGQVPRNPTWILNGLVKGTLGFKVKLPIIGTLADYQTTLFDTSREFRRAGNTPPQLDFTDKTKPASPGVPASVDLHVPVNFRAGCDNLGSFYFTARDAEDGCAVKITATSDRDGPLTPDYTFQSVGQRVITVTAQDTLGASTTKTFALNVVNTTPKVKLQYTGDPAQGEGFTLTATITDPNETDPSSLCALTTWAVDAPDTLANPSGCFQTITFGATGPRQLRVTTKDHDGAFDTQTITLTVQPPPVNPYPRITAAGLYSRDVRSVPPGTVPISRCVDNLTANNTPIDLRDQGCTLLIGVGTPPPRYSGGVTVDNPSGEVLTYDWTLYVTNAQGVERVLASSQAQATPGFPLSVGGNNAEVTTPCRLTVRVNAPDPARSKSQPVWTGSCTYYASTIG